MNETMIPMIPMIRAAMAAWTRCDWTHEADHFDGLGNQEYCSGGKEDSCSYCRQMREAAKSAYYLGEQACAALTRGDTATALDAVEQAVVAERESGDATYWRPVLAALKALEAP